MMGLQVESSKWWHYLVTSWGILSVQQLAAACKGRMTTNEGKQNKKTKQQQNTPQKWKYLGRWMENEKLLSDG